MSRAGGVLLTETVRVVGLDRPLSTALAPWRRPTAVHDPAKVLVDLAVTLALGGDCLALGQGGRYADVAWPGRAGAAGLGCD